MSKKIRNYLIYFGIPLIIFIGCYIAIKNTGQDAKLKYSEIVQLFNDDKVKSYDYNIGSGQLTYYLKGDSSNKKYSYVVPDSTYFFYDVQKPLSESIREGKHDKVTYDVHSGGGMNWIMNILPMFIVLAITVFFWIFIMRRMGGMGGDKTMTFGKAKFKQISDEKRKTTFADVAGADEEKEELWEIVEFLKNPRKFNDIGARIPKGVLLVGPPGTGKTLLARAVAGEAGVPFFSISGSDFVEMFVGVGASRVRDLFAQAKKNSPAIVFIDEIDAVGRHRGAGLGGGNDEREQTLNQLLVEMDGFGANDGVIIIAATNRPDVLDPALLRPGRFDRQVTVSYPDVKGREEILKVHARGKSIAPDVNLKTIAQSTAGFTGADLENLLNESALLAARLGKKAITMDEVREATIKVVMGPEKKSRKVTEADKRNTAVHEAGHAVVSYFLSTQDPVHEISIIARGMAAGYTMYLPKDDKSFVTKTQLIEDICGLLGGRAAEQVILDDICTGASNDIERATDIARKMVTKYGMSNKLGTLSFDGGSGDSIFLGRDYAQQKSYSEDVAAKIDAEIEEIVNRQYDRAIELISQHKSELTKLADYLIVNEKIDGKDFTKYMETGELPSTSETSENSDTPEDK